MDTILIVSHEGDAHAQHVIKRASERGISAFLFNTGDLTRFANCSLTLFPEIEEFSLTISGKEIKTSEIKGVWWRRPRGVKRMMQLGMLEKYIDIETEMLSQSLDVLLPLVNWVSLPGTTRLGCRKIVQLQVARRIGFKIPDTCVGNSPDKVLEFINKLNGKKMIVKPIGTAFVQLSVNGEVGENKNKAIFTRIVDKKIIQQNINLVSNCPVIFQEAINKEFDIRVTVIDETVFSAAIYLDGCDDPDNLDWKIFSGIRRYELHQLPKGVESLCVQIAKELGLRFGCIDLGYSKKDGYTFFEINPQGQWLPSELKLSYPISDCLLDALVKV